MNYVINRISHHSQTWYFAYVPLISPLSNPISPGYGIFEWIYSDNIRGMENTMRYYVPTVIILLALRFRLIVASKIMHIINDLKKIEIICQKGHDNNFKICIIAACRTNLFLFDFSLLIIQLSLNSIPFFLKLLFFLDLFSTLSFSFCLFLALFSSICCFMYSYK